MSWTRKPQTRSLLVPIGTFFAALLLLSPASIGKTLAIDTSNTAASSPVLAAATDTTPPSVTTDLRTNNDQGTPTCPTSIIQPMIHTLGIEYLHPVADTAYATLRYRVSKNGDWITGQDAVMTNLGTLNGSIFWLAPETQYDVEITTHNRDGVALTVNLCTVSTQPDMLPTIAGRTIYVSAAATPPGDGSAARPFTTVQAAVNVAQPGDTVQVGAGTYYEGVVVPTSGNVGAMIRIVGQPGTTLDGSDPEILTHGLTWTADQTHDGVYTTTLAANTLNAWYLPNDPIWRDGDHFYTYDTLANTQSGTAHDGTPMAEGWFFDTTSRVLSIRSLTNPSSHTWHIRSHDVGIRVELHDYISIENLNFQFYPEAVYIRSGSHNVLRHNTLLAKTAVMIDDRSGLSPDDNRIEANHMSDAPVADWGYGPVKGTTMEAAAIAVWSGARTIIRDNRIENYHDGIATDDVTETDIYRNYIRHLSDDGLEPDGKAENMRIWGNVVDDTLSALSLAPVRVGPTWAIYNRFTQFSGRGFKIGASVDSSIFLFHNTVVSSIAGSYGTQQVTDDTARIVFRNNIIEALNPSDGLSIRWTIPMPGVDMDYDAAYTATYWKYQWNNHMYHTLADVCTDTSFECHGDQREQGLINPGSGSYELSAASPAIDTALRLPGINDAFTGNGPDRGYLEYGQHEIQW